MAEAASPDRTPLDVSAALSGPRRQQRARCLRLVRAFRRGWALIRGALLDHEPGPMGSLIDATSLVHYSGVLYNVAA